MSVMSRSTTYLGPQSRLGKISIEKKAWFMFKILCHDLSGATFAQIRELMDCRSGFKTKVKLSYKGWKVGSRVTLNPKVQYEFYPFNIIDRILQDLRYINVLLLVLNVDQDRSDVPCKYEIIAYKFKNQSSAFRFQDIFNKLAGTGHSMQRTMSRTELSLGSLSLVPAKSYPMGPLAVDRWGGHQIPRSEASYGRSIHHTKHFPAGKTIKPSILVHDDRSDLGSFDSSENATTTYREVAVSANISAPDKNGGKPVMRSETNFHGVRNSSDPWRQADSLNGGREDWSQEGEVSAIVNSHQQNFNGSSILSDDSRFATSSIDDSGFYGATDIATAHVHGHRTNEGIDLVDGTVSVRKIFNKQTKNGSSKGFEVGHAKGSNASSSIGPDDQYYQYRNVQVLSPGMMDKKARSIDHLAPNTMIYKNQFQQIPHPTSRGPSRSDLHDNASVASQGSVYLLNPRFKKSYMNKNNRMDGESAYTHKLIGQY